MKSRIWFILKYQFHCSFYRIQLGKTQIDILGKVSEVTLSDLHNWKYDIVFVSKISNKSDRYQYFALEIQIQFVLQILR